MACALADPGPQTQALGRMQARRWTRARGSGPGPGGEPRPGGGPMQAPRQWTRARRGPGPGGHPGPAVPSSSRKSVFSQPNRLEP